MQKNPTITTLWRTLYCIVYLESVVSQQQQQNWLGMVVMMQHFSGFQFQSGAFQSALMCP